MTEKKVFSYIEEYHMIEPAERIVLGVSGGADSVCLLFMLLAYRETTPLSLSVVHVNHGIRPDAGEDARFVEELCRREEIPFSLIDADVHKFVREEKCSEEDAGRRIRYEAFRRTAEAWGGTKIAVAHNSDDNAETMLFHLFRGSGIGGLSGIAPVRRDEEGCLDIIRPILCLERREVETYLRERGEAWRTDSTNQGDDYVRNRIRHHILPCVERDIAAGAVSRMRCAGELLRETEDFLERQTGEALEACLRDQTGRHQGGDPYAGQAAEACLRDKAEPGETGKRQIYVLDVNKFAEFHVALRRRMLFKLLKRLSPAGKDISAVHVRDMLALFSGEKHRSVHLPFGITARRQYGQVILEQGVGERRGRKEKCGGKEGNGAGEKGERGKLRREVLLTENLFSSPSLCDLGEAGKVEFWAFERKKGMEVSRNRYTKWFDYDKIEKYAEIRTRSVGDFLTIADGAGNTVHKSLKDYMITEKIPRQLRDEIPVLAAGNHIIWLVGWRISEHYKVDENTRRILRVRFWAQRNMECTGSETEEENVGTH